MNKRRIIHYIVLCLAVWLPLDNALAATVVSGCPMMSHAFERGLAATYTREKSAPCHHQHAAAHKTAAHTTVTDTPSHCTSKHCCALCLLFGATGLPSQAQQLTTVQTSDALIAAPLTIAPEGRQATPFRPPIV